MAFISPIQVYFSDNYTVDVVCDCLFKLFNSTVKHTVHAISRTTMPQTLLFFMQRKSKH